MLLLNTGYLLFMGQGWNKDPKVVLELIESGAKVTLVLKWGELRFMKLLNGIATQK